MTTQAPNTRVDLDLDELQPGRKNIRIKGRVYWLPGEIPVPVINRAIQLTEHADLAMEKTDDVQTQGRAGLTLLQEMYELVYDLLEDENEDMPESLPLGMDALTRILGLIIAGRPIDLEQAVAESLNPPGYDDDVKAGKQSDTPTQKTSAKPKRTSRSRTSSRARS